MNTDRAAGLALAKAVAAGVSTGTKAQVAIYPPFPYLPLISEALCATGSQVILGAQDVYHAEKGAFTGEVSVAMLKDVGCRAVLTGHSERRHVLHEGDDLINMKTLAALNGGLICTTSTSGSCGRGFAG